MLLQAFWGKSPYMLVLDFMIQLDRVSKVLSRRMVILLISERTRFLDFTSAIGLIK